MTTDTMSAEEAQRLKTDARLAREFADVKDREAAWIALELAEAQQERDALRAQLAQVTAERDALRAIVEGRTTPPSDDEIAAHGGPECSGWWLVSSPDDMSLEIIEQPQERDWCIQWGATHWLPIDLDGRPCAWPVVDR